MDLPNEQKQVDLASAYYTKGRKLWSKGDRDNALDLFRKALAIQESILGIYNKQTARTYYWVGYALNHKKEYNKALVAYRRTLRIRLFLLGEDDASTEDVKRALRDVLKEQGLNDARVKTYIKTVAAAVEHEKQAIIHEERSEYVEAVEEYEKYLAIEEASVGNFPLDIARIHSKIADIYKLNKKETMALSSYRHALSIFVSKLGRSHSDSQHCISGIEVCASIRGLPASESEQYVELVLESISLIWQGDELKSRGKVDDALNKYEEALKIESMAIGIYPLTAAELHLDIAHCYRRQKEFDRAIVMLRTALSVYIFEHDEEHRSVVSCLREIASTLQEKGCSSADMKKYLNTVSYSVKHERSGQTMRNEGDLAGAITEFQRSLELEVAALGKYHLTQVALYKAIARAYGARGEHSFASSSYRTALLICMKTLGLGHPTTQALFNETYEAAKREGSDCTTIEAYENLVSSSIELQMTGIEQLEQGQYVKAFATFRKAIVAQEEVSGQYHICTSDLYSNVAKALFHAGQDERALKKYRELLAIHQSAFGPNHPSSKRALQGIGETLTSKRVKIEIANEYSEKVIESIAHELTGDSEIKQDLYDQAILSYEQALKTERNLLGESYLTTAGLLDKLASAYRLRGEHHQAILIYRKSIQIYQSYDEPEYGDTQGTLKHLSLSIRSLGFNMSAVERYQHSIQTSIAYETQGDAALLTGNSAKAVSKYQMAIDIEENSLGKLHPTTSSFYKKIADISRDKEDFESALLFYSKALAIQESYLGKDNEETVTTYNQLMNAAQKHGSKSGASLEGWNMLKYVLMGLIGLLVLIITVAKSISTSQRTIKRLNIAAYDDVEDSKDEDPDDKEGDNPKRPLEPPEDRHISRGPWSANSSSYETMSERFDNLPGDSRSPSISRRLAGKSVGGENFELDKSVILKPSLSKEEPSSWRSAKDAIVAPEKTTSLKGAYRKEDDHVGATVVNPIFSLEKAAQRKQLPSRKVGEDGSNPEIETKPIALKVDGMASPLSIKGEVETKDDGEKERESKSPVPKEDGVGGILGDASKNTTDTGGEDSKMKKSPTEGVVSRSSVEEGQTSSGEETIPDVADSEDLMDNQDDKPSVSTETKTQSWDEVLNVPQQSEEVKTPSIDEKIKSQKTLKKKDDKGAGGSLSNMLKKWRNKADNEEGDIEEEASGLDNRIKQWKQAADRASSRHLGA
ncbi:unnamed protein product [Cylindrotheca closterium]|uniref:Uncharacterized protein n=1 Tax=Cylindrotheca closterium TaxID=2856 RepID=A0AAD2FCG9_9STRA|nr:unnamed protein product [Cylindrotheca closterium]